METGDLPILPGALRAAFNYAKMKRGMRYIHLRIGRWSPKPGSGWGLAYRILRLNSLIVSVMLGLTVLDVLLVYTPHLFLKLFVAYLEVDKAREDTGWGWIYVIGLFVSKAVKYLGEY